MSLLKIIEPSWDFHQPVTQLVKIASSGVTYHDKVFLRKIASSDFADRVHNELRPTKGEEYLHVIALGAHEYYGPNRKGDTFEEKVCRKYHVTFEKHAKWYRNHVHHDPSRSYGVVKLSHYDEEKKRIDLIVALNATPEAAKKNGGLVADKELDALFNGEILPVSMSCLVSHDICSGCGHKARSVNDRCTERICVKYGGCAKNMGRTFKDGHTLCVFNPDPIFFDISYVNVPADRIAYSVGILKNPNIPAKKLADLTSGKAIYKQLLSPPGFVDQIYRDPRQLEEYEKLRQLVIKEAKLCSSDYATAFTPTARNIYKHLSEEIVSPLGFACAAFDLSCLPPPEIFFSKIYPSVTKMACANPFVDVSNCFTLLFSSENLGSELFTNPYCTTTKAHGSDYRILKNAEVDWSFDDCFIKARISRLEWSEDDMIVKRAEVSNTELAKEYAKFALAFLARHGYKDIYSEKVIVANKSWFSR